MARQIEIAALALGYMRDRTAAGHLLFVHKVTGKTVITPSKGGGTLELKAYAELRRGARL